MTVLESRPYAIPAANLGDENPLPMFRGVEEDGKMHLHANLTEDDRRWMGLKTAWRALPHRIQDGYDRNKVERPLESLVLENPHVRATFLPGLGGRLASLYQKDAQRELLARNPVFQPANLALRNAWFSGGVEWNTAQPGHHYLTCSPLFAARVEGPGYPVLRMYEWDRVKCFPYQMDFHLPPDSPFLFVHIRLVNPHPHEMAMYWWTNIAVEEREDVRVVVPAETALGHGYDAGLAVVDLPSPRGHDLTYATRTPHAYDFFSRIPDGRRRFIAALGTDGSGFFQTSTDRLRGRKLFCWGMSQGGRRWQEFLAAPGHAYIEIQAGLTQTQMETIPMPAGATWDWTEAFGLLSADPAKVHGEWSGAWPEVDARIQEILRRDEVEARHIEFARIASLPPVGVLRQGSGWAALEQKRLAGSGERSYITSATPFGEESLTKEQGPWLELLESGFLPDRDPESGPGALMTQFEWGPLLEASVRNSDGVNWCAWYHLGNLRMESHDSGGAREAWERSLDLRRTGWALRNLAVLSERNGDSGRACELLGEAWEAGPKVAALAVEILDALNKAGRHSEAMDFTETLSDSVRGHERVMLHWAKAALETGRLDGVERIFEHEFAIIREGEVTLTDLWYAWHERRVSQEERIPADDALRDRIRREFPPPRHIDFRMSG